MASTFSAAVTKAWNEILSGATYSRIGIQHDGKRVDVYVGPIAPVETQNFMILGPDNSREIVIDLLAAEKVYVRSEVQQSVGVRGFREVR